MGSRAVGPLLMAINRFGPFCHSFCCKRCSCQCFDVDIFISCFSQSCLKRKKKQVEIKKEAETATTFFYCYPLTHRRTQTLNAEILTQILEFTTSYKHMRSNILPLKRGQAYLCVSGLTVWFFFTVSQKLCECVTLYQRRGEAYCLSCLSVLCCSIVTHALLGLLLVVA